MGMGLNLEVVEATYTCSYCGVTFGSQEELDSHIRGFHIAGIPEWLKKNWPYVAIIGCFGAMGIIFLSLAIKKK